MGRINPEQLFAVRGKFRLRLTSLTVRKSGRHLNREFSGNFLTSLENRIRLNKLLLIFLPVNNHQFIGDQVYEKCFDCG